MWGLISSLQKPDTEYLQKHAFKSIQITAEFILACMLSSIWIEIELMASSFWTDAEAHIFELQRAYFSLCWAKVEIALSLCLRLLEGMSFNDNLAKHIFSIDKKEPSNNVSK